MLLRAAPTFPLSFLAQVGKTSLIMALVGEEFPEEVSAELQGGAGTAVSGCGPRRLEAERCFLRAPTHAASPFECCSSGASFPAAPSGALQPHRSTATEPMEGAGPRLPFCVAGAGPGTEQGCHCGLQPAYTCPSGPLAVWLAVPSQLGCRRGTALFHQQPARRQIVLNGKHKLAGEQLVSSTFLFHSKAQAISLACLQLPGAQAGARGALEGLVWGWQL